MHVIHCNGNVTVSVKLHCDTPAKLTRVTTDRLFPQTPSRKPVCFVYNVSFAGFEMNKQQKHSRPRRTKTGPTKPHDMEYLFTHMCCTCVFFLAAKSRGDATTGGSEK